MSYLSVKMVMVMTNDHSRVISKEALPPRQEDDYNMIDNDFNGWNIGDDCKGVDNGNDDNNCYNE